jgi:P-type Cu+ transporter
MAMPKEQTDILLNIEGMDCANCAIGITKRLESRGLNNVNVNFATGEATFNIADKSALPQVISDIQKLGYKVIDKPQDHNKTLSTIEKRFYFSLVFTIPLFLHMVLPFTFLHNPFVQLILCLPVFFTGIFHFGRSALSSLRSGVPNMDVLIAVGSSAAFLYSLIGTLKYYGTPLVHDYLFYETSATIITLVLLGNVLEHRSVRQTTSAIRDLSLLQVTKARKVLNIDGKEQIIELNFDEVKPGDELLVNNGDKIPVDGIVLSGNASVDESMISGESIPLEKNTGSKVIGGTILIDGNFRMKAEKVGKETVLSKIIEMVKAAQNTKPSVQKLGDRVSAVFVPVVIGISVLTFLLSYFLFSVSLRDSLMHSIAVLVISCPCAMGLATPTAVMVGIGRAAKKGILIKGGSTLEELAGIKTIVFDKTGTLTTGNFKIKKIHSINGNEKALRSVIYNLEKNSSHPIAKSLVAELSTEAEEITFSGIRETKGMGIEGIDSSNNHYMLGSYSIASKFTDDDSHQVYLIKNGQLEGWLDLEDEIKIGAAESIKKLSDSGIKTVLLSGDSLEKTGEVSAKLGIKENTGRMFPEEKLKRIEALSLNHKTAMVGDGINDAPALAKATVGISLSNATQIAVQSAQVILLNGDISKVYEAYQISRHTLITIRQNLFWAFFYNVVAIPIAASGFLNPMVAAFAMAFSDVIVIGNSIRLRTKKLSE